MKSKKREKVRREKTVNKEIDNWKGRSEDDSSVNKCGSDAFSVDEEWWAKYQSIEDSRKK